MHYTFKTFLSGTGDCIMLLIENNGVEVHIMVDCGVYSKDIKDFIHNKFHNVIDYLIVTHIDNDHILGVISMLETETNLTVNQILYNCYQRRDNKGKTWDDRMKQNIKRLYGSLPPVIDMIEGKISSDSSLTLAELILGNGQWRKVWKREYITDKTSDIPLGEGLGRIVFLSPNSDALTVLDMQYRMLFWQKLYKQKNEDYQSEESIYEALLRILNQEEILDSLYKAHEVTSIHLTDDKLKEFAARKLEKLSINNVASIAFIWEEGNHRILFLGDSDPAEVTKALKQKYQNEHLPIEFDAIKVSHHGSAHSTSLDILKVANSEHFFFTGGSNKAPSLEAMSRIIISPIADDDRKRVLHFNRKNDNVNLIQNQNIMDQYKFEIDLTNNELSC